MAYLLDTNVISEYRKDRCDPNVRSWFASIAGVDTYLSAIVIGELTTGVQRLYRRDLTQATLLGDWVYRIKQEYASRIIPVDTATAIIWGKWRAAFQLPAADGLMAATAFLHDWTFVTRNAKHVERTGVRVLNPFLPL